MSDSHIKSKLFGASFEAKGESVNVSGWFQDWLASVESSHKQLDQLAELEREKAILLAVGSRIDELLNKKLTENQQCSTEG